VIEIRPLTAPARACATIRRDHGARRRAAAPPLYREPRAPLPRGPSFGRAASSTGRADAPSRLFVPDGTPSAKRPLLVMLHGLQAERAGLRARHAHERNWRRARAGWLLYPEQRLTAILGLGCWNWFKAGNQQRGRGEPKILADLVRHVVAADGIVPAARLRRRACRRAARWPRRWPAPIRSCSRR
jgi:poly(3-hydroxybutyrate) depolymerase